MTLDEIERVAYANNDQARIQLLQQAEDELLSGMVSESELADVQSDLTGAEKEGAELHVLESWVESVVAALRGASGPMTPKQCAALADIIETFAAEGRRPTSSHEHARANNLLYEAMDLVDD